MVVFIDDLDRCGKESLIEVLEAVNFLASSGDCFIVLGMSPKWVEGCVGLAYEDLAQAMAAEYPTDGEGSGSEAARSVEQRRRFAKNYLEKLINIEVPIPDLATERAGLLVASPTEPVPQPADWGTRRHRAGALMPAAGKPLLVIAALGYGLWFGLDLLHKPAATEPKQAAHWSTGRVRLVPPRDASHNDADRAEGGSDGARQTPLSGDPVDNPEAVALPDAQAGIDAVQQRPQPRQPPQHMNAGSDVGDARGRAASDTDPGDLSRTLSELLGVEISIQADEALLDQGSEQPDGG